MNEFTSLSAAQETFRNIVTLTTASVTEKLYNSLLHAQVLWKQKLRLRQAIGLLFSI